MTKVSKCGLVGSQYTEHPVGGWRSVQETLIMPRFHTAIAIAALLSLSLSLYGNRLSDSDSNAYILYTGIAITIAKNGYRTHSIFSNSES